MSILVVVVVLLRTVDARFGRIIQSSVHGAIKTLVIHTNSVVWGRWSLKNMNEN